MLCPLHMPTQRHTERGFLSTVASLAGPGGPEQHPPKLFVLRMHHNMDRVAGEEVKQKSLN